MASLFSICGIPLTMRDIGIIIQTYTSLENINEIYYII